MTNCRGTPAEHFAEAYITGTLPEAEASEFEEHYFDCPECLAQVEAIQTAAQTLARLPRKPMRKPIPWPVRLAGLGAIAAALMVGYFALRPSRPVQPGTAKVPAVPLLANPQTTPQKAAQRQLQSTEVAQLADLTLPPFRAPNLRGGSGDPHFEAGMRAYASGDCARGIKSLSLVPADDADAVAAHFYRGVCQVHLGDLEGGSASLRAVANHGDSPQQEAAFYYLAQVELAGNDGVAARRTLMRTIALRGDFERRAQLQLKNLSTAMNGR
jgi:anti-sigma factor RsiW